MFEDEQMDDEYSDREEEPQAGIEDGEEAYMYSEEILYPHEEDEDDDGSNFLEDYVPEADAIVLTRDDFVNRSTAQFGRDACKDMMTLVACCQVAQVCAWVVEAYDLRREWSLEWNKVRNRERHRRKEQLHVPQGILSRRIFTLQDRYHKVIASIPRIQNALVWIRKRFSGLVLEQLSAPMEMAAKCFNFVPDGEIYSELYDAPEGQEDLKPGDAELAIYNQLASEVSVFIRKVDEVIGMELAKQVSTEIVFSNSENFDERLRHVSLRLLTEMANAQEVSTIKELGGKKSAKEVFRHFWDTRTTNTWITLDELADYGAPATLEKRIREIESISIGRTFALECRRKTLNVEAAWRFRYQGSSLILGSQAKS